MNSGGGSTGRLVGVLCLDLSDIIKICMDGNNSEYNTCPAIAPVLWSLFPLTVKATPFGALDLTSRFAARFVNFTLKPFIFTLYEYIGDEPEAVW